MKMICPHLKEKGFCISGDNKCPHFHPSEVMSLCQSIEEATRQIIHFQELRERACAELDVLEFELKQSKKVSGNKGLSKYLRKIRKFWKNFEKEPEKRICRLCGRFGHYQKTCKI